MPARRNGVEAGLNNKMLRAKAGEQGVSGLGLLIASLCR